MDPRTRRASPIATFTGMNRWFMHTPIIPTFITAIGTSAEPIEGVCTQGSAYRVISSSGSE